MQVGTGNQNAAGNNQQETQMQSAYSSATAAAPQAQTQQAPVGSGGLRNMFTRGRAPGARDANGRVLTDLATKMNDYREKPNDQDVKNLDIKIIPIPRGSIIDQQFTNQISLLVFALGDGTGKTYSYHTLLIASEMPASAPTRNDGYGYNFDNATPPRVPSLLADDPLAGVIKRKVQQSIPQATVYSADWEVVPDGFKINDPYAIEDLFYNALRACWAELDSKSADFTYDSLEGSAGDNTAIVSIHVNQDQSNMPTDKIDKVGLPIRAEMLIDFRSEQPRTTSKDMNTENTANVIEFGQVMAMATLFIDPVAARQSQYNTGQGNGAMDTQDYIGEITLTGIDIYNKVDLSTVLLMISTAFPLLDTNTRPWLRNFLPRHLQSNSGRGGQFRPRDLGALNFDYKWKEAGSSVIEPFNTSNETEFTIDNFNYLTNTLIQQGVGLAIDVPECGDSTWYLRPFAEANDVPAAREAIIKAADGLTGGRFSFHFNQTQSRMIMLPRVDRVLNGYFPAEDGKLTDLRVIDMPYLMNRKGHINPNIGREWSATFGGSTDAQLAARAKLIEDEVASVTYTGISIHKVFSPDFLLSLDRAIADTGLKLRNEMSREDSRLLARHSYGLAQAGGLMTNFTSSMYTTGGYQSNGGAYRGMAHNRQY